jgi:deoxyribose-phosphate aldolase
MTARLRGRALARHIDISCVQAFHTAADVAALAAAANAHEFVAAHVLPNFVPLLKQELGPNTRTLVGSPVGFPSGGATTATKVGEARELVGMGGQELDLVINIGRLKSGDLVYVNTEIRAVVDAIAPLPLKVLLEIYLLTDDEICQACDLAVEAGAKFVKTGSGWVSGDTLIPKVRLIADTVRGAIGIKASGGIRDLATIDALCDLGVTRFGVNSQAAIALVTSKDTQN